MHQKKTDSLSTASLMGVEIQHEFVYPLEDAFAVYLSDYFDNSLFVIQGRHHPLAGVSDKVIKKIVGHKGQGVTEVVYTHFEIEELIDAINKI